MGLLVGLVSDSHDNGPALAEAVRLFRARGVGFVLHAGDVCSSATLAGLRPLRGAVALGNNDPEDLAAPGFEVARVWEGEVGGRRVAVVHGDDRRALAAAVASRPEVVVTGHSHRARDERVDGVRVLNPGALFRAAEYSVMVFDTADLGVERVAVARSVPGL